MEYVYRTQGTCSTNIELNVEDGVVKEVAFWLRTPSLSLSLAGKVSIDVQTTHWRQPCTLFYLYLS